MQRVDIPCHDWHGIFISKFMRLTLYYRYLSQMRFLHLLIQSSLLSTQQLISGLTKLIPKAETELAFHNKFQCLMSVLFSAQSTDVQVNKATKPLWEKVETAQDMIDMGEDNLREHIKTIGLYKNKAKFAMQTAHILQEQYNGEPPVNFKKLQTLPGVGIKTAKVFLSDQYGLPYLAVDTHVHRVLNRLGFVKTSLPEQTDKLADKIFTGENMRSLHHRLILFGRYHCIAKKPKCDSCPFIKECAYKK
ncbi:MAG: endonuclease III [Patescibacteria group bacterium]|nr:endonuclease III [Patescibacteria group bacterium]